MVVRLYNIHETSKILQVSRNFVAKLIQKGKLTASKVGKKYMITEENINNFIKLTEINNEQESNDWNKSQRSSLEGNGDNLQCGSTNTGTELS